MTKVEAILHLYRRGMITEAKAYALAKSRHLTNAEIEELRRQIELIKNPPVEEEEPEEETTPEDDDTNTDNTTPVPSDDDETTTD